MSKLSNQEETNVDNQLVTRKKKLEKLYDDIQASELGLCPIRDVFSVVSDKWSTLIFFHLGVHPQLRFNELKKLIKGISSKVLSERLKRLERDGYISREVHLEVPVKVEYQLTNFGKKYLDKAVDLVEWMTQVTPEIIQRRKEADQTDEATS